MNLFLRIRRLYLRNASVYIFSLIGRKLRQGLKFVQKNNSVWEATLHIADTQNGEKILYDIDPIKKVERSGKSDTTSTTDSIRQGRAKSQQISEKNNEKSVIDDLGKIQYQLRIEDKNRLNILEGLKPMRKSTGFFCCLKFRGIIIS